MIKPPEQLTEFDFFMDEDVRSRRIGVLCMEKRLTPALTQALFRVREEARQFHYNRIREGAKGTASQETDDLSSVFKQIREIKWSELNLMRSFIAIEFIKQFFHYWDKGPLPIMFFNTPFEVNHLTSINNFFKRLKKLKNAPFSDMRLSESVFFLDYFTTASGYKFEEKVRNSNNLSRCYRIDSRSHDLMQLADLLLGITTYKLVKKKTTSKAKQKVLYNFDSQRKVKENEKTHPYECVYILD